MRNWKKIFIVVLLVLIGFGLEYGINPTPVDASSKIEYSVIQKPTDPPKDKPIKVIVSGEGKFCYLFILNIYMNYIWVLICNLFQF
ncbi:DUF1561 family protein [Leptospira sp. severe_002]|uniref:DUF1561 family protein n=1 Tax=Leptospira sp. severe_002 TaxID=2838237 RepID=UPI0027D30BE3|nr:DUF1561 family protein [Leptospira sp. severe_002]